MENNNHTKWFGIGKQVASFIAGILVAAFVLGSARQKMSDLQKWKDEVAPRIERMDRSGTTSFDLFHQEYLRTQEKQERRIEKLEEEIRRR
jgi:hypothetical protein